MIYDYSDQNGLLRRLTLERIERRNSLDKDSSMHHAALLGSTSNHPIDVGTSLPSTTPALPSPGALEEINNHDRASGGVAGGGAAVVSSQLTNRVLQFESPREKREQREQHSASRSRTPKDDTPSTKVVLPDHAKDMILALAECRGGAAIYEVHKIAAITSEEVTDATYKAIVKTLAQSVPLPLTVTTYDGYQDFLCALLEEVHAVLSPADRREFFSLPVADTRLRRWRLRFQGTTFMWPRPAPALKLLCELLDAPDLFPGLTIYVPKRKMILTLLQPDPVDKGVWLVRDENGVPRSERITGKGKINWVDTEDGDHMEGLSPLSMAEDEAAFVNPIYKNKAFPRWLLIILANHRGGTASSFNAPKRGPHPLLSGNGSSSDDDDDDVAHICSLCCDCEVQIKILCPHARCAAIYCKKCLKRYMQMSGRRGSSSAPQSVPLCPECRQPILRIQDLETGDVTDVNEVLQQEDTHSNNGAPVPTTTNNDRRVLRVLRNLIG